MLIKAEDHRQAGNSDRPRPIVMGGQGQESRSSTLRFQRVSTVEKRRKL